jgi:hypothetical protein
MTISQSQWLHSVQSTRCSTLDSALWLVSRSRTVCAVNYRADLAWQATHLPSNMCSSRANPTDMPHICNQTCVVNHTTELIQLICHTSTSEHVWQIYAYHIHKSAAMLRGCNCTSASQYISFNATHAHLHMCDTHRVFGISGTLWTIMEPSKNTIISKSADLHQFRLFS